MTHKMSKVIEFLTKKKNFICLASYAFIIILVEGLIINHWFGIGIIPKRSRLIAYLGLSVFPISFLIWELQPIKNIRQKIVSVFVYFTDNLKRVDVWLGVKIDASKLSLSEYLKENIFTIIVIAFVTLAAYGFEIFNFNITIDEEIQAFHFAPLEWLAQGRWGMYLLNKYLLPYTVIPFVSLFIGLLFHMVAILLLLKCWRVNSKIEQIVIGAICITFPTLAYDYTFSTFAYGIGIGFFCVALSLFLYVRYVGLYRYLSIIPAAFAISIYQGLALPLVLVFIVFLIDYGINNQDKIFNQIAQIAVIQLLSVLLYLVVQQILFIINKITLSNYVSGFFSISQLKDNYKYILGQCWVMITGVYLGDISIYSYKIEGLGLFILIILIGLGARLLMSKAGMITKLLVFLLTLGLFFLPFVSGLLMNGHYDIRFLLGIPVAFAGLTMLSLRINLRIYKILIGFLALGCIFQFIRADNHLFASSNIALQADRSVGTRLLERIEESKAAEEPGAQLKYLEIVGYLSYPDSDLMPQYSTFGASFFGWDQGNPSRALYFLRTLGYEGLQPLPINQRSMMIGLAEKMPAWPAEGSVKVVGDIVLVKFGSYSYSQKMNICAGGILQKPGDPSLDVKTCMSNLFSE